MSRTSDDGGGSFTFLQIDLDMSNSTFGRPDLSALMVLDDLGVEEMGLRVGGGRTVLACMVVGEDRWCRQYGARALYATR